MPHPDAARWNTRFEEDAEKWLNREPSALLAAFSHLLPKRGLALDAACGPGANGLFLAQRGLHMIGLDISEAGLNLAKKKFQASNLPLDAAVYDLAKLWLPAQTFEVILNFFYLERTAFPQYRKALKPGGLLYFETFLHAQDTDVPADYFLAEGELLDVFRDYEIVHTAVYPAHHNDRTTEQLVARKPMQPGR